MARKVHSIPKVLVTLGMWFRHSQCLSDAPPPTDFRWRSLQSVAKLGSYLYIDGGEVSQYVDGEDDVLSARPTNSTLSIALDQAWTPSNLSINIIHKGPSPSVKNPALWPDTVSDVLYSWSGEGFFPNTSAASNIHLWKFTPDGKGSGSWAADGAPGEGIRPGTSGTSVVCAERGFLLGGYGSYATDTWYKSNTPQPGMLVYDLDTGTWENVTAPSPYSPHLQGQAACLPFGAEGIISFFGGAQMTKTSVSALEFVSFDNMTFYDPRTKEWLWQTTTGDIPEERRRYCAVGAAGPNGTFDIFLYGGLNPSSAVLSDVHILSIPAFRWFRASTDNSPRVDQKCAVVGNRQMISVGGHMQTDNPGPGDLVDPAQDPWAQGIGVFDMSTLAWTHNYDPEALAYEPPADIQAWYNSNDLNSVLWINSQVKSLFLNGTSITSSSPQETTAPSTSTPVGPIVGGVVGGLAVLAILAGGMYVWHRRRRDKQFRGSELETPSPGYDRVQKADPDFGTEHEAVTAPQEMPVPTEEPNSKYRLAGHVAELSAVTEYHEAP